MPEQQLLWQIQPKIEPPESFFQAVKQHTATPDCHRIAQLLWQRRLCEPEKLASFLYPEAYEPASPFEFGQEMSAAVKRLQCAYENTEKVAIWGDFDADGITATAVLWDGLGEFFEQNQQLTYYIPNRLTESHGLNLAGIDRLAAEGTHLIITCDTGSTNLAEIDYANHLGIDVIITDHHTLPATRPPVVAIINPRNLPLDHPLYHLSGVAVAYKLIEAFYQTLPEIPQHPLEYLLDLVAIGLIADLVQLTGDCRYLAQVGIQQLQRQLTHPTRPGVAKLLELCQRSGDRPTDISFGIGPRINAVSRIQGDARFCVELLTSRDVKRCEQLARETELANSRRKSLQHEVAKDVANKLAKLDVSTTSVIVLSDPQWSIGVLGLVAGQVAQEYGRPTILLSTAAGDAAEGEKPEAAGENTRLHLARGSARSTHQIDLYQLVKEQAHLLHRFGGHPYAAGLSLPVENIPLFTESVNLQLRQQIAAYYGDGETTLLTPIVQADLTCTVAELGYELFQELKLLEPCGMGNPVPKLFIPNCWFENVWHRKEQDASGQKIQYIKTDFNLWDNSTEVEFPGVWWGHYKDEVPQGRCDAIVELDYNAFKKRYEVRLMAVRPAVEIPIHSFSHPIDWIVDGRELPGKNPEAIETPLTTNFQNSPHTESSIKIQECPTSWDEFRVNFRKAFHQRQTLVIAYAAPPPLSPIAIWHQLIGIAKYLSRTGQSVTRQQLYQKLKIRDKPLQLGFQALSALGFKVTYRDQAFYVTLSPSPSSPLNTLYSSTVTQFLAAIQEEQFRRQYFSKVSLATIQAMAAQTVLQELDDFRF